jgi:hypothetical protein
MRWFAGDLVGRCTRGAVLPAAVLVATAVVAVAAVPAGATITPVTHDTQGSLQAVQAAAAPSFTVGGQGAFFLPAAPGNSVGNRCDRGAELPARRQHVPRALDR